MAELAAEQTSGELHDIIDSFNASEQFIVTFRKPVSMEVQAELGRLAGQLHINLLPLPQSTDPEVLALQLRQRRITVLSLFKWEEFMKLVRTEDILRIDRYKEQ